MSHQEVSTMIEKKSKGCCYPPRILEAVKDLVCRTNFLEEQVQQLEENLMVDPYSSEDLDGARNSLDFQSERTDGCDSIIQQICQHKSEIQRLLTMLCKDNEHCLGDSCQFREFSVNLKSQRGSWSDDIPEQKNSKLLNGKCPSCSQNFLKDDKIRKNETGRQRSRLGKLFKAFCRQR